jgi:hypothetical protein
MAKRRSVMAQRGTVCRWLLSNDRRASEAAMEASAMGVAKVRKLSRALTELLAAGELEQVCIDVDGVRRWVIRRKIIETQPKAAL